MFRTQQLAVLFPDRLVALTSAFFQTLNIQNMDLAAGVPDHAGGLECVRNGRHARSPHTKHFGQKFLGER
jgi:hypothetical protein